MGSESLAHEPTNLQLLRQLLTNVKDKANRQGAVYKIKMGYWLRDHKGERNNCFSQIQLVGQKNISETKQFD